LKFETLGLPESNSVGDVTADILHSGHCSVAEAWRAIHLTPTIQQRHDFMTMLAVVQPTHQNSDLISKKTLSSVLHRNWKHEINEKPRHCWERADRTAFSGIPVQNADNGYSRRGNFGGSLACNMVLIYSPYSTNVYGSRGGEFDG